MNHFEMTVWIGFVLFLGAFTQGAVGFGLGLVAIPLLVLGEIPLPTAIAVMLVTMLFTNSTSCLKYRGSIHWKTVWPLVSMHLIGLPFGVLTLVYIEGFNPSVAKAVVGIMVLIAVFAQWALKVKPRDHVNAVWGWGAGLGSGYIEGLVGMGSPPLVLYVMMQKWDLDRIRTTIWVVFLSDVIPLLLLLSYEFKGEIVYAVYLGVFLFPVSVCGTLLGNKAGHWLGVEKLRWVAYMILVLLGMVSVCLPLAKWTHHALLAGKY
ncbi:Sulfite exporter TauE/SafE [Poriferisphaera corsica]|uniref:Probable membrane transporter protein n=1 Tax=Poriferisphaera corsica TaxID=2528020 RepID=A0A517YYT3_9BACT|nr:sulfite exporter TauE/SafE family protein [Poriferisphaera corsica]QDU35382.1 Sulfite exporter TauE/SafE [Poriferisphaera corsica]